MTVTVEFVDGPLAGESTEYDADLVINEFKLAGVTYATLGCVEAAGELCVLYAVVDDASA
jgi:hypothetical protein